MEDYTFTQHLILLLVALLFFRDEIIPWIKSKLGFSNENSKATKGQVSELAEYVNHRQTEVLDRQTQLLEKQNAQLETQTQIMAGVKIGVDDVKRKHEEWDKYGVPTRKSS